MGEVALSIAEKDETEESYVLTIRSVGTATRALEHCKQGDIVGIRGPFGKGWPLEEAVSKDILLVAGGIGLPPLWSTLPFIFKDRSNYGEVFLLYGARSPHDILYKESWESLSKQKELVLKISVELATSRNWNGSIGNVISLVDSLRFNPQSVVAFVCGPEPMMRFCAYALLKRGVAKESIYFSMERNMRCAIGSCGHCQFGPLFLCKNGPVFSYKTIEPFLNIPEI
ncbi:FAD/NAD(P)-binding protein [Methylacidiphilum caldifontis]|uniref:FAD/NAD(P)-binding protein n=1 Tax=Methylacidiphilum caldifontis TaxID=2795386 RepID=UPI001FCA4505|nr:FAD/NAD(P)-binding protein [Methylacidiphilum caldifontis]